MKKTPACKSSDALQPMLAGRATTIRKPPKMFVTSTSANFDASLFPSFATICARRSSGKGTKEKHLWVPAREVAAKTGWPASGRKASQVILCKCESRYHSDALSIAGKGCTHGSIHVRETDAPPRFHFASHRTESDVLISGDFEKPRRSDKGLRFA